jgi:serine/threonine-protein kinase
VYALGVVIYRSVAGEMPWETDGQTAVLLAHLHTEPKPLPTVAGDALPVELAALCERCLDKEPAQRPTAAEVNRALVDLLAGAPVALEAPVAVGSGGTANDQTTFLPFGAPTGSPSGVGPSSGGAPTAPTDGARRRAPWWLRPAVATAAACALALTGIGAALARDDGAQAGAATGQQPTPTPSPTPELTACQAIYQMRSDDGKRFAGDLTVVNTGATALRDWTLSFRYAGNQRATGSGLRQDGDAVTVGPVDELPAGEKVTYRFSGTYRGVNPMPMSFAVDEVACDTRLVGPVGATTPATSATRAVPDGQAAPPQPGGPGKPPPNDKGKKPKDPKK